MRKSVSAPRLTSHLRRLAAETDESATVALFVQLCRQSPTLRHWLWEDFSLAWMSSEETRRVPRIHRFHRRENRPTERSAKPGHPRSNFLEKSGLDTGLSRRLVADSTGHRIKVRPLKGRGIKRGSEIGENRFGALVDQPLEHANAVSERIPRRKIRPQEFR